MDRVAAGREPQGVVARAAADIQHQRQWVGQVPQEQLLGAVTFEHAHLLDEALVFLAPRVKSQHLGGRFWLRAKGHRRQATSAAL